MKNFILTAYACIISVVVAAQVSAGPVAGTYISKGVGTVKSAGMKANTIYPGWRAGAAALIGLHKHFLIQPIAVYEKLESVSPTVGVSCVAAYNLCTNKGGLLFAGAGPYMVIGKSYNPAFLTTTTIPQFKTVNFGVHVNAGFRFSNGLFFTAHFQRVMTNMLSQEHINTSIYKDQTWHYHTYGLSAGYLYTFSKDKKDQIKSAKKR